MIKKTKALLIAAVTAGMFAVATSGWAVSCYQCNLQFERCLSSSQAPGNCLQQFFTCASQVEGFCYLY